MTRRVPALSLPVLAAETAGKTGKTGEWGKDHDSGRSTDPKRRGEDSPFIPQNARWRAICVPPPNSKESSLRDQLETVLRYARDHGMQLIRIYCDECGSGLRNRQPSRVSGSCSAISKGGASDFGDVLLLNRSRWSRSLYPDHSQLIEDRCKKAGIAVHYCAEGLMDDQIAISTLVKSIKRAMVREYPRKLTNPRQPRRGLLKRGIAAGNYGGGLDRPAVQDTEAPKCGRRQPCAPGTRMNGCPT